MNEILIYAGGALLFSWFAFSMLKMNRAIKHAISKNEELMVPHWFRHLYMVFAVFFAFMAVTNLLRAMAGIVA